MNTVSTMNELSNLHNNRTMSSREIAELTGKEHKNVIADIRHVIETLSDTEEITGLKFQPSGYWDAKGMVSVLPTPSVEHKQRRVPV